MTEQLQNQSEISLSQIPMQESEVLLVRNSSMVEEKKIDESQVPPAPTISETQEVLTSLVESEQTVLGGDVGISISDMRVSQQAEIRRVRFSQSGAEEVTTQTRFIVSEAATDEEIEQSQEDEKETKKKQKEEDTLYFFGYFKWYWGKHGFIKAFKNFFWERIKNGIIFSIFNSIGMAIGTFFFKRLVLANTFLKVYY